jgi:hypothetical protein
MTTKSKASRRLVLTAGLASAAMGGACSSADQAQDAANFALEKSKPAAQRSAYIQRLGTWRTYGVPEKDIPSFEQFIAGRDPLQEAQDRAGSGAGGGGGGGGGGH